MVLFDIVWVPEVEESPVILPAPVILVIVLPETVAALLNDTARPVTALVPAVQLLKVLPVTVLVGEPPSVLAQPAMVVAPVTVIFEKSLPVFISLTVAPDDELEV